MQATPCRLAPAGDQPVDEQDDDRADDRGEEAGAFALLVPAEHVAEIAGQRGAADAERDRDQAAARVAARHDELGDPSRQRTDDDPPQPAIVREQVHVRFLRVAGASAAYHIEVEMTQQNSYRRGSAATGGAVAITGLSQVTYSANTVADAARGPPCRCWGQ